MQILFAWDSQPTVDPDDARQIAADGSENILLRKEATDMATAAWQQREATDAWVQRLAPNWSIQRQPSVDRSILRLATWEMINTSTPATVVIDEAIELAKAFSTRQSPAFINGVLDSIRKEHNALTGKDGEKN